MNNAIDLDELIVWRAGYIAAEHFVSHALGASPKPAAEYLTRYINGRAAISATA